MRNIQNNLFQTQSLELDRQLASGLKELGLVKNDAELSRLLGKNSSYIGCMRHKGFGIPIGTLAATTIMQSLHLRNSLGTPEEMEMWQKGLFLLKHILDAKCQLQRLMLQFSDWSAQRERNNSSLNTTTDQNHESR